MDDSAESIPDPGEGWDVHIPFCVSHPQTELLIWIYLEFQVRLSYEIFPIICLFVSCLGFPMDVSIVSTAWEHWQSYFVLSFTLEVIFWPMIGVEWLWLSFKVSWFFPLFFFIRCAAMRSLSCFISFMHLLETRQSSKCIK